LGIFLTPDSVLAYGETATNIINELSTSHINRASGSDKEAITGDYIKGLFTSYGLTTTVQPFTYQRAVPENNMVWGIALATAFLLCHRKKPANLRK
jgi:hypothetical protein